MLRKFVFAICGLALMACQSRRARVDLSDTAPAYTEPQTTSVFGDWVLSESPNATAFRGAQLVAMNLTATTFRITIHYPTEATPLVISGATGRSSTGGLLTLTPGSISDAGQGASARNDFHVGSPITVLASAAGNTLVFADPYKTTQPSSIWARREAAAAAGIIDTTTGRPPAKKP
ncbi:MAG: hypothetical protein ABR543_17985 [Gemmatimonadaceae bacterium]